MDDSKAIEWSSYQKAVFDDVKSGKGHTVIRARAGSGKTKTIVESMEYVPSHMTSLMLAFNKNIANELKERAPSNCHVQTTHAYGLKACFGAFPKVRIEEGRTNKLALKLLGERVKYGRGPIKDLVSKAKNLMLSTLDDLDCAIDEHGIDIPTSTTRDQLLSDAMAVLQASLQVEDEIDFDDMVWLPVALNLRTKKYPRVFIDETQDLNETQLRLCLSSVTKDGRIVAVGDDRQAIYGFRGAGGAAAMDRIITGLEAKVLPLSVTYRCATAIVELAKLEVPDLEAAPGAAAGEITRGKWEDHRSKIGPGDFVLGRYNAPLVKEVLRFIREGRRVCMLGRDAGAALSNMLRKSKETEVQAFLTWLDAWEVAEVARMDAKGRDPSGVYDKTATLRALCEGERFVDAVAGRIELFFADKPSSDSVVFSTTHKAKGLEANRVFMMADTYRRTDIEERNLWYVAVTRAKRELFMLDIGMPRFGEKKAPTAGHPAVGGDEDGDAGGFRL